jgi:hypothetical protein
MSAINLVTEIPYQTNGRRTAAKFVINRHHSTSSVSFMIEKLDWKSLENWEKHLARLTIIMYKLANEWSK